MRIAQLSDLHLTHSTKSPGQDPWEMVSHALNCIQDGGAEWIWITGDICDDKADLAIYLRLKTQLETLGIPYHLVAGNHDDSAMMAEVWPSRCPHLMPISATVGEASAIFMDTSTYRFRPRNLLELSKFAENNARAVIVTHIPPTYVGRAYLDLVGSFRDMQSWYDWAKKHRDIECLIFAGHYHAATIQQYGRHTVYVAPSTKVQKVYTKAERAQPAPLIGWRWIYFNHPNISTSVEYII